MKFKLYQMDIESVFLNRFLDEKVYVEQPKGLTDPSSPGHVYKLKNTLYGMKYALRDWYERLIEFITCNGYVRGGTENTKKEEGKLMIT